MFCCTGRFKPPQGTQVLAILVVDLLPRKTTVRGGPSTRTFHVSNSASSAFGSKNYLPLLHTNPRIGMGHGLAAQQGKRCAGNGSKTLY